MDSVMLGPIDLREIGALGLLVMLILCIPINLMHKHLREDYEKSKDKDNTEGN